MKAAETGDDEKAIAGLVAAFTKAFNGGDAAAAAATFAEDALVVDEHGERIEGRAAIRAGLAASFAENPGSTIAIKVDSLRFLGPDTALEEGRTTITPAEAGAAPEITRFTVVYIKKNGQWLQSAVRDEHAHDLGPHDRLKELEWLVGDWINESQDAVVNTTCKWTEDGNFLIRDFTMKTQGQPVLSGTQRIGWDAVKRQFKTWIFDSEGGLWRGVLDPRRRPLAGQGRRRATGWPARVGHEYHHPSRQGSDRLAIGRPHASEVPRSRGSTSSPSCASHPSPASKNADFLGNFFHSSSSSSRTCFMTRRLSKLVLGTALVILVSPPDIFAGRGGGYGGGGGAVTAVAVAAVTMAVVAADTVVAAVTAMGRAEPPRSASHASRRVSRDTAAFGCGITPRVPRRSAGYANNRTRLTPQVPPPPARAMPIATRAKA